MTAITYERATIPTARCSTSWCELPADHDFVVSDGTRMHSVTLATWEKDGRHVYVQIEAPAETVDGVEKVEEPRINLYPAVEASDDMTPEQARTLAAFVSVALNAAADRVEQITAARS
jgi:hypothetical protein